MHKRKFYAIGHNSNTINEADLFLQAGFNALGPDLNYTEGQYYISHDWLPESARNEHSLINYLAGLRNLVEVKGYNLALIAFDVKAPVFNINNCVKIIYDNYLKYPACSGTAVIITTAYLKDAAFISTYNNSLANIGVGIDEHSNAFEVYDELQSINNAVYGNGITTLLPKPGLYNSINIAKYLQALDGSFKFVMVWVLALESSMRNYLQLGVDGILTDLKDTETLLNLLKEPAFAQRFELAQMGDNPFTVSIPAYALTVKTSNTFLAGTDSRIRFTLTGTEGSAEAIIDASLDGMMEKDSLNYIALEGTNVDDIISLTIEFLQGGISDGWLPEFVKVEGPLHKAVVFTYSQADWINSDRSLLTKLPDPALPLLV